MRHPGVAALYLAAVCAAVIPGWGQTFTGSVSGIVADSTGAVLPGTAITIADMERGTNFRTQSNDTGFYVVSSLPPGRYRINAEKAGFGAFALEPLELRTQQKATVNITLEIGQLAERIQVTAESQLVESASSTLGAVVENKRIVDLPLNGRNIFDLAVLVPGVFRPRPTLAAGENFMGNRFIVNGGQEETNDITVDGVSATLPHNQSNITAVSAIPSIEGVQEFRVQTNAYSAEYGRSGGGVVSLVTKSGTNELHGSLFEFLRNSVMDSNSWQANRAGINLASFKRNQFGYSVGGPLVIPKVYNGRNRTFFFHLFEGTRIRAASTAQYTVATEMERRGDFTETFIANGQRKLIYDPFTTRANPNQAGRFIRDPFPGNVLPQGRLDPVAVNAQKFVPLPNGPGLPFTRANNLVLQVANAIPQDRAEVKIDHNFNERQRIFGRYTFIETLVGSPNFWNTAAMPNDGNRYERLQNAALDYTHTLRPTMVLNLRYGFGRAAGTRHPYGWGVKPSDLGLPTSIDSVVDEPIFPTFSPQDHAQIGANGGSFWQMRNGTHIMIANLSQTKGRHSLKYGYEGRVNINNFQQLGSPSGTFTFGRAMTQGPDARTATAAGGIGYASFLLGTGTAGSLTKGIRPANANHYRAFYFNDDFKAARRLTLNLGFRWDFESAVTERFDRLAVIDPYVRNPLGERVGMDLRGGYLFAGQSLGRREARATSFRQMNPRFGFAYELKPGTVIRGAYGIFFGVPAYAVNPRFVAGGFSSSTPWLASVDGITPTNLLRNPFPGAFNLPRGTVDGLLSQVGEALSGPWPEALRPVYNQQWNFTIQKSLPGNMMWEVAYAANKGTNLSLNTLLNQLHPDLLTMGNRLLEQVPNPFFGHINVGVMSQPTVQRGYLLRNYPHFTDVTAAVSGWGSSNYHALQTRLEKRYARGLNATVSYTWSKTIADPVDGNWAGGANTLRDAYCRKCDRSISSYDQPHRFVTSLNYELPFGRGKSLFSGWSKWADAMFGQWQVNGILTLSSGMPMPFQVPQNTSFSYGGNQRPDATNVNADLGSARTLARWFDTSQFSQPREFTFGNLGRIHPNLRADGLQLVDFSVFKMFRVRERARIELRGEAFNLLNHPMFGQPGTTVNTPLFGVVSGQENPPRQVQLGLKIIF
ncbi:MAG: TonB-dependent receptor [Bryobacteraceae bacterium]|nr:TonB-dependent receptor [Bryobacteraceae bacterium]